MQHTCKVIDKSYIPTFIVIKFSPRLIKVNEVTNRHLDLLIDDSIIKYNCPFKIIGKILIQALQIKDAFIFLRLKKKMLCFRFPDRLVKICADCNFFSAQKKKKSRRPTLFNDSGFYQKSKPFRYENLSAQIFGYFRSLTITIKNNNMATV